MIIYRKPTGCRSKKGGHIMNKSAEERKNEILDVAERLFFSKGYEQTNTNEIVKEVGIARGTLYHHFKNKEELMDGIIHRKVTEIYIKAEKISNATYASYEKQILDMLFSMKITDDMPMMDHIHQPENAQIHNRIESEILCRITPLITRVIELGIAEGVYTTKYPQEVVEMIFIYANHIFDAPYMAFNQDQMGQKVDAFVTHLELLLGAKQGSFELLKQALL